MQPATFEPDPVDFQQLELLGRVSPQQRLLTMMNTAEWVLAGLRGALSKKFPEWSQRELNLRVMAYVTTIRGVTVEELLRQWD